MSFLFLSAEIISQVAQSVFIKLYGRKVKGGDITFSAVMVITALLFFGVMAIGEPFSFEVVPYSLLFAITYVLGTLMYIMAVNCGSLGLTALIISYSLMVPTVYGLLFWNETLDTVQIIGIIMLCVSLFLVRDKAEPSENGRNDKKGFSKWLIYISLAFIGNGLCSVVQRQQQIVFNEKYDMSFMVVSLAIAVPIMLAAVIVLDRKNAAVSVKKGGLYAVGCGVTNGTANLFVILTLGGGLMSAALFYPVVAAGQTILTFAVSVLLFGEHYIPRQWIGIALGTVSLVLMNI